MAEWSCSGLQIRLRRFDSGSRLQITGLEYASSKSLTTQASVPLPSQVRDNAAWDFLGQLAGKSSHTALLSDIAQNRKTLFR